MTFVLSPYVRHLLAACNSSSKVSDTLFWPPQAPTHMYTDTERETSIPESKNKQVFSLRNKASNMRDVQYTGKHLT